MRLWYIFLSARWANKSGEIISPERRANRRMPAFIATKSVSTAPGQTVVTPTL